MNVSVSVNSPANLSELENQNEFVRRHIGPGQQEIAEMLAEVGADSLDDLMHQTVPASIRSNGLNVGPAQREEVALAALKNMAAKNKIFRSYIGMGYSNTFTPNVILRNVLENPGWYTAYTPYQPEIAQGRLQAILNFQQATIDLTGLPLASASLLDEATAAAEAMALAKRVSKNKRANSFFIANDVHPQTKDVLKTRADMFGFDLVYGELEDAANSDIFGALLQYPTSSGAIVDIRETIAAVQANKGVVAVATDLLALTLITPPGELGADVAFGSAQRFGVPMGYGGPHAAFFATRDNYKRSLPGRIIGVSKDTRGKSALRMALQTREQHIRREKANSNICTAQVLLANMASFYAVYHGPKGLEAIAERIHRLTDILAIGLVSNGGVELLNNTYFDTLSLKVQNKQQVLEAAKAHGMNLRSDIDGCVGVSLDETTTRADVQDLFDVLLGEGHGLDVAILDAKIIAQGSTSIPASVARTSNFLTHPVFNSYHSETEMLRYIKSLENKDLALNHSMISLGSCTMKLNATAEMIPVTWPEFGQIHPFAPVDQAQGYKAMLDELSEWLIDITGYDALSMQPNSGAQGEYAGLLAIQRYHQSRGDEHRNVCLIPQSAHGTNPASAQMVSLKVVVVNCDSNGNVDLDDLRAKAEEVKDNLSCAMITYPSTHGVYEETVREICDIVHEFGGQVYMDGANMNAQVGITSPGLIGSDVSHLNLHKTFCIPHGGGGPGMGPIGVKSHLAPFLPSHTLIHLTAAGTNDDLGTNSAVAAAPWGSASILPISYMYIKMMGSDGLKRATEVAMLNANYIAKKLEGHYPILYTGRNDRIAHECIVDLRPLKEASGVTEVDIAKRLNDYGFHAPTMSFPVAGTLMIEPTESEAKIELDRFIEAMVCIREEIAKVESGEWDANDNPLHHAPHTLADMVDDNWNRSYSRQLGAYPVPAVAANKFWPTVNRIDDVFGDRNLICSCPDLDSYRDFAE
ncbi:aminomethyl-transferring glycine dehydrogenase [Glaciecola petra]|uniref:Glycine dehydrogenase (decarboxylating) n=1 Tax=Glaciecola petra TaxID=3075602 RepID=A0ABU2ZMB4_9ALTE|nr:aminomethyl-transferring glycine dehydrogenase [Aestuariibacter sp. P117]MDT0593540.1 aminomethyl-transferring glycine dehydrogenase [Aestuariibacter sp. P117]